MPLIGNQEEGSKKRVTANLLSNAYAQAVATLSQLVLVPIFLYHWQKEIYGEWILLSTIPTYLSLAEGGFGTLAGNEVSMASAKGEVAEAQESLHTAWGFLVGASSLAFVVAIPLSLFVPWTTILNLVAIDAKQASLVVFTLCMYSVVGISYPIFTAIHRAVLRNARSITITSSAKLAELIVTVVLVSTSSSIVRLAVTLLTVRVLLFAIMWHDCGRLAPHLRLGFAHFSRRRLKATWRPSLMFIAFGAANALYFQGLTFIVGNVLGPGAVVTFNATRALTRAIVQLVTLVKHSIWPEFSYLYAKRELKKARALNALALEASLLIAAGFSLVILTCGGFIMKYWTHGKVQDDRALVAIFLLSAVFNSIWYVTSGFLMGINKHEGLGFRYIVAAIATILCGLVTVRLWGLYGAAGAMIVCELVLLPYALRRTCELLNESVASLMSDVVRLGSLRRYLERRFRGVGERLG